MSNKRTNFTTTKEIDNPPIIINVTTLGIGNDKSKERKTK